MSILKIVFREGPLEGKTSEHDLLVPLVIGRAPETGGLFLPEDSSVSRKHGELRNDGGKIVYENLSSNPALFNGKPVKGTKTLAHGDRLRFGIHELQIQIEGGEKRKSSGTGLGSLKIFQEGPLANPLVQIFLGLYLVAFVGIVLFFTFGGGLDGGGSWTQARTEYTESYVAEGLDTSEKEARLERADQIVEELFAYEQTDRRSAARAACEELMALDSDPDSPIFRYAANRRARLYR